MLSGEETGVMGPGEKGLEKFLIFLLRIHFTESGRCWRMERQPELASTLMLMENGGCLLETFCSILTR